MFRFSLFFALALAAAGTAAADLQEHAKIGATAKRFAEAQTAGTTGEVSVTVGPIDARLRLPACPTSKLLAFLPPGSKLWGNTNVGVRCTAPSAWTLYVPLTVKVSGDVVVTARALSHGQLLTERDIEVRRLDLTQQPPGVLSDPLQAVGKTLAFSVPAAHALRQDLLRSPPAVQQGQAVRIVAQGKGFSVTSEGRALANAAEGQVVQVRTESGQTVKGIARKGGIVEVNF